MTQDGPTLYSYFIYAFRTKYQTMSDVTTTAPKHDSMHKGNTKENPLPRVPTMDEMTVLRLHPCPAMRIVVFKRDGAIVSFRPLLRV